MKIADDFVPKEDDEGNLVVEPEDYMLNYVTVTRAKHVLDQGPLDPACW